MVSESVGIIESETGDDDDDTLRDGSLLLTDPQNLVNARSPASGKKHDTIAFARTRLFRSQVR